MFRLRFILFLPALLLRPGISAEAPPPVRVDAGYTSAHVFRGVERARDSMHAGIELNHEHFRAQLWGNQPFRRGDAGELSLGATTAWQPADGLGLEFSLNHTWFGHVPGGGLTRAFEAGLSATLPPVRGFAPTLALCHDFRLQADTAQLSLARSVALTRLGAFLELNFHAGLVKGRDWRPDAAGPRRRDGYGYWGADAQLPYRFGAHSTLVTGLHYADSIGRSPVNGPFGRSSAAKLWVTLGLSLDY
jgi:hypothetical protein